MNAIAVLLMAYGTPATLDDIEPYYTDIRRGKKPTPELIAEAGKAASEECTPTSDLRGSEQYKRAIIGTLVRRALTAACRNALA